MLTESNHDEALKALDRPETRVYERAGIIDIVTPGLRAICLCRKHHKVWEEGDFFEDAGGKACRECAKVFNQAYPLGAPMNQHKLCYVGNGTAYFTRLPLSAQWGDDWNDAPYEHNAGTPYEHLDDGADIMKIKFEFRSGDSMVTPDEGHSNSPWSVQTINKGAVPWLRNDQVRIFAGVSPEFFSQAITEQGGTVYLEHKPRKARLTFK